MKYTQITNETKHKIQELLYSLFDSVTDEQRGVIREINKEFALSGNAEHQVKKDTKSNKEM